MNIPQEILNHVLTFEEIAWGSLLISITMALHTAGMIFTLSTIKRYSRWYLIKIEIVRATVILVMATLLILFVHLVEVLIWSAFFVWSGALPTASVAFYYALNQYTTVGSDVDLVPRWQLLSGLIAIAGLMTFAWSTTVLLTLIQNNLGEASGSAGNGQP